MWFVSGHPSIRNSQEWSNITPKVLAWSTRSYVNQSLPPSSTLSFCGLDPPTLQTFGPPCYTWNMPTPSCSGLSICSLLCLECSSPVIHMACSHVAFQFLFQYHQLKDFPWPFYIKQHDHLTPLVFPSLPQHQLHIVFSLYASWQKRIGT